MLCNWFLVRNFDTYKPRVWATSSQNQFEIFPNEGNIQYFVGLTRTVFTLEYDDFTWGDSYLSSCISLLAELLEYTTNAFISWDSISDSLRSKSCDWMDKIVWSSDGNSSRIQSKVSVRQEELFRMNSCWSKSFQ